MSAESLVKIIPSKRDTLGRIKVESPVHHPVNAFLVKETIAGPIYRIPLSPKVICWLEEVEVPEFLNATTSSVRGRKALAFGLHVNSRRMYNKECNREIGKPNSAFVGFKDSTLVVDHLFENKMFERQDASKLHDIIRENVDYAKEFQPIDGNIIVLSGHIAPINISTKSAVYVVLLDLFKGKNAYQDSCLGLKRIIKLLYAARIVPITSDGYLIKLDSKGK